MGHANAMPRTQKFLRGDFRDFGQFERSVLLQQNLRTDPITRFVAFAQGTG